MNPITPGYNMGDLQQPHNGNGAIDGSRYVRGARESLNARAEENGREEDPESEQAQKPKKNPGKAKRRVEAPAVWVVEASEPWVDLLRRGRQMVVGQPAVGDWAAIAPADIVIIRTAGPGPRALWEPPGNGVRAQVVSTRTYTCGQDAPRRFLAGEGLTSVAPDATGFASGLEQCQALWHAGAAQSAGIRAARVELIKDRRDEG